MDDIYQDFWEAFLEETGTPENTVLDGYTYFGASEEESVAVLEQILSGEKDAVGHCLPAYLAMEHRLPKIGDYTMVMDFYGNPCCILKAVDVVIDPLNAISPALRAREWPGLTPEAWLERKQKEYGDLSRQFGFHYHPELPILLEIVERVYPVRD